MNKLPVHTSMLQSSSKKDLNTLRMSGRKQGEGEKQLDIQEQQSCKKVKTNSVLPSTSINQFLKKYGIHVGGENSPNIQPVDEVRFMSSPVVDEHEIEMDNFDAQAGVGDDEFVRDEDVNIDSAADGILEKKRVRGQATCKNIHARSFEEREEVIFDKGQAVGPTDKRMSDLTNFIGTIARNPRFITLVHTSWHAVSQDIKRRMWEYVNSKFIIPAEGEKWVMTGLRDAWRRHKRNIKMKYFNKNATDEDMLQNHPNEIPEVQFRQLIEYWKDSDVQAMCQLNSENRKKKKWRHRMGPINFGRIRVALRATKENNEEPSKSEMLIATRTKKGKEVHTDTQVAISLNFRIVKVPERQQMMHLGLWLERSSLVGLDAMAYR
ncbi:PREDICTED: uncharacterized protein LOC109235239 [Nicotiana attenuata]|uniref:uncharacterized protein LOC109235239 n=1 Tax=Nicotiana attenuata TaxID=49451 RepID=UPI0009054411|nr:PREDICTED: uncharacterized protein LOC109235239 [Nicotiana attenuata]